MPNSKNIETITNNGATSNSKSLNISGDSIPNGSGKSRKRKRCEVVKFNDIEATFDENTLAHAVAIEKKLRTVAKANALSDDEMRMLVQKFVKNDHVLALVTLEAENEMAREQQEQTAEQCAILITDTPSVLKLTRAKARELNKTPALTLSPIMAVDSPEPEIAALIKDDLNSDDDDEEDEEYTFKDEDFISDDEVNTTVSDLDSNPRTPQTPLTQIDCDNSPVKLTADGCFKIPLDANPTTLEDLRIHTRTRSKFCLEQTTIEAIQSEFVPPDVEQAELLENDATATDVDWMEFLHDFSKPLNASIVGIDDDDPINDPEYVAADQIPFDAEELRNVNISKKELTALVTELFEGLVDAGVTLESIELDTPQKFLQNPVIVEDEQLPAMPLAVATTQNCVSDSTISSTNATQLDYSYQPDLISIPLPLADKTAPMETTASKEAPQWVVTPIAEPPNCSQQTIDDVSVHKMRYSLPYDNNYTCKYISIKKHLYAEYAQYYEQLRNERPSATILPTMSPSEQYALLQQQLRIHVQLVTQTFLQSYSHATYWPLARHAKKMLDDLEKQSAQHIVLRVGNLGAAVALVAQWEADLSRDTLENKRMMEFQNNEIDLTSGNTRQIPRFVPRIMELMLNSSVFMYPRFLPRIPFTPKTRNSGRGGCFAPSESHLIALGLEKHMALIHKTGERLARRTKPLKLACERLARNDTVFGKGARHVWDHIEYLRTSDFYNPVQYYLEHKRAPPVHHEFFTFDERYALTPRERFAELPLAWQTYLKEPHSLSNTIRKSTNAIQPTKKARTSYVEFVQEALGCIGAEEVEATYINCGDARLKQHRNKQRPREVIINVNYMFGANHTANNSSQYTPGTREPLTSQVAPNISAIKADDRLFAYNYDCNTQTLCPVLKESTENADYKFRATVPRRALNGSRKRRHHNTWRKRLKKLQRHTTRFHRPKFDIRKHCFNLVVTYQQLLLEYRKRYIHHPQVQHFYQRFKALELYTELLRDLKMFCRHNNNSIIAPSPAATTATGPSHACTIGLGNKRTRNTALTGSSATGTTMSHEDEIGSSAGAAGRSKKANRQEENYRHMLTPDTAEEANRKDAIYAFNFYERVEEVLKLSKRPEDCTKFNSILTTFDPTRDKVADLYYQIEQLLLPEHPDLAEVFLTFLMPSEAAEIGKFFAHFMVTNVTTFIKKLHKYFNKQPAQLRKIYQCLNELSDDREVTMKTIEQKILPLLKGNQFLIDWFMAQFPPEAPSERLLPAPEQVNLKEVQSNQSGEFYENINELLDSPTQQEQQQSSCQLKYINGRIFYGTKLMLPAKLSFMASSSHGDQPMADTELMHRGAHNCAHGIREYGEQRLNAAAAHSAATASDGVVTDDYDKSEEEDNSNKILIIDTNSSATSGCTGTEEDGYSSSSVETCDETALRAHAIRLNPHCYGHNYDTCTMVSSTSVAQTTTNTQLHNNNSSGNGIGNSTSSKRNDEGKISPRKQAQGATTSACKSPTKKSRSPIAAANRGRLQQQHQQVPMVVIHHSNGQTASPAIAYAKKLKSFIEAATNTYEDQEEPYAKEHIRIIARPKQSLTGRDIPQPSIANVEILSPKLEKCDDFLEYTPEKPSDTDIPLTDLIVPGERVSQSMTPPPNASSSSNTKKATSSAAISDSSAAKTPSSNSTWTRDEDKIVLLEMKHGTQDLLWRVRDKLPTRTHEEIQTHCQFLMDVLSQLQAK